MMAKKCSDVSVGPLCDTVGMTELAIIDDSLHELSHGLTNMIIFELDSYRKGHKVCWNDFYSWIEQLYQNKANFCSLSTFKVYIGIEKKVSKLKKEQTASNSSGILGKALFIKRNRPQGVNL